MIITEALARADTVHAVFFLLAAYIEAVQSHDGGLTLPEAITRLPVRGERDLATRHADARALYTRCLGETGRQVPLIAELSDVYGVALNRLRTLQWPWAA